MSEKSKAEVLADVLGDPRMVVFFEQRFKAAAELRRLSAENEMLWKEREEPHKTTDMYIRECNRLESERDEARLTVREAHDAGTRLTAQRDALLEALKRVLPHAEDSMTRPELDIDLLDARAAIKAVEE